MAELLTHWGPVTHICIGKLTIIGSDNGLSSWRRQAIIWSNAGILLIGPLGTNFNFLIEIDTFSFKKMHLKSSAKWRPFCLGLNVLNWRVPDSNHHSVSPDWCMSVPGIISFSYCTAIRHATVKGGQRDGNAFHFSVRFIWVVKFNTLYPHC